MLDIKRRHVLSALVLIAVFSRIVMILGLPMDYEANRGGDEWFYHKIAESIVTDGEYNEWNLKAFRPPAYPFFIALHLALFGDNQLVVQIIQNLLFLITIGVFSFAVRNVAGSTMGILCGFLLVANPFWLSIPQQMRAETLFMFLISIAVFLSTKLLSKPKWGTALLMGLAVGFAALTREIGLFIGIVLIALIWRFLNQNGLRRSRALITMMSLLGMFVVILPWTLRNAMVFRSFVLISTNGPINVYLGNNPLATGGWNWQLPDAVEAKWNTPSEYGAHEIEAARVSGKTALTYMVSNPGRTVSLSIKKFWLLWKPIPVWRTWFSLDSRFQVDLEKREVSEGLRAAFKDAGIYLSEDVEVVVQSEGGWTIADDAKQREYVIAEHKGKLDVHKHGRELNFQSVYRGLRFLYWPPYFALACFGLWLSRKNPLAVMILGICVIATLIHMVTFSEPLYRAPYEFLLAMPAAMGIMTIYRRISVRSQA